jgi:hypothetical protein
MILPFSNCIKENILPGEATNHTFSKGTVYIDGIDIGGFEEFNPATENRIAQNFSEGALGISANPDIAFAAPISKTNRILEFIGFQLDFLKGNTVDTVHSKYRGQSPLDLETVILSLVIT